MTSTRTAFSLVTSVSLVAMLFAMGILDQVKAAPAQQPALGIDVDFYTGPISESVWLQMKQAGMQFVIAQAWGGRSRNEFAPSQLSGGRLTGGMLTAAYVLLNYDGKVCPTFADPKRDSGGRCIGKLVSQEKPGSRWQVQQGIAALGAELADVAFIAIDVEWFLTTPPPADAAARSRRRQHILEAIDEVRKWNKRPIIYTRNARKHWVDITGCDPNSAQSDCLTLYGLINDPLNPIPLWDVQHGDPELGNFAPHGAWTERAGRQYKLDINLFGLPRARTVDLNVFDLSLFSL